MTQIPTLKQQAIDCIQFAYGGLAGGLFGFFVVQTLANLAGISL
jgi:hypothetical protein